MKTATWIKISLFVFITAITTIARAETLHLYNDTRKESLDITYRNAQGIPIPSALKKIEVFLRSPDNQTHPIDIQLIDLVYRIQDHFNEPVIEIISGYRSPDYNHSLKLEGHAVANESLHMQGRAVDIHLDTVTEEAVRDYALSLKRGGVGWYPQNDFVHVDVGETRTWGRPEGTRKWVGLNNNTGSLIIRTNANRYFRGDDVHVNILSISTPHLWTLEHFDRGQWKSVPTKVGKPLTGANLRVSHTTTDPLTRGRYRLRISDSLSNEFYLKN